MATLITSADVTARFDVSPDIDPVRIDPHVGTASRRLRKWVGETNYANAITGGGAYEEMQADLRNAEAHLAFHFMIYGLNMPFSTKGIVATSMAGEGKEMRKYLTPDETQKAAGQMLELAREIAGPYLVLVDTPTGGYEVLIDEE